MRKFAAYLKSHQPPRKMEHRNRLSQLDPWSGFPVKIFIVASYVLAQLRSNPSIHAAGMGSSGPPRASCSRSGGLPCTGHTCTCPLRPLLVEGSKLCISLPSADLMLCMHTSPCQIDLFEIRGANLEVWEDSKGKEPPKTSLQYRKEIHQYSAELFKSKKLVHLFGKSLPGLDYACRKTSRVVS